MLLVREFYHRPPDIRIWRKAKHYLSAKPGENHRKNQKSFRGKDRKYDFDIQPDTGYLDKYPTGYQRIKDRFRGMWRGLKKGKIDNFTDHNIGDYVTHIKKLVDGLETPQI